MDYFGSFSNTVRLHVLWDPKYLTFDQDSNVSATMDPPFCTNSLKAPSRWKGLVPPGDGLCRGGGVMFSSDDSNLHVPVKVGMVLPWSLKVGKISRGLLMFGVLNVFF